LLVHGLERRKSNNPFIPNAKAWSEMALPFFILNKRQFQTILLVWNNLLGEMLLLKSDFFRKAGELLGNLGALLYFFPVHHFFLRKADIP